MGCPAHTIVKEYHLYPEYKITETEAKSLKVHEIRQLKKSKHTKALVAATQLKFEKRFFISLPTKGMATKSNDKIWKYNVIQCCVEHKCRNLVQLTKQPSDIPSSLRDTTACTSLQGNFYKYSYIMQCTCIYSSYMYILLACATFT